MEAENENKNAFVDCSKFMAHIICCTSTIMAATFFYSEKHQTEKIRNPKKDYWTHIPI